MATTPAQQGQILSYLEMCQLESSSLQRGMNFHLNGGQSVLLMSTRRGAPYQDRVEEDGRVLIYEGHDAPAANGTPDPKLVDQPRTTPRGELTQNGLFEQAADRFRNGLAPPELVRVYEKVKQGIWVFNGTFRLTDARREHSGSRLVFKFRLELSEAGEHERTDADREIPHRRVIPSSVKLTVWKRDGGKCVICGSTDNLHYDHVIPFSRGGSSLVAENIQVLCARHNIGKRDRIA